MLSVSVHLKNSDWSFFEASPEDLNRIKIVGAPFNARSNRDGGLGPGTRRTRPDPALRLDPRHLLFPDPAAHEEAAEEGAGVPGRPQGGRQGRDDERALRADYAPERRVGAGANRGQGQD